MRERSPVQSIAALVGVVFLLVGILGFVPGITTHYGDLSFAGHGSGAKLLGIFQVSVLHNIVHLLFGIVGLAFARTADGARTYLVGGGVVYLVLWVIGLVGAADWIPANTADNWLHFALGVGMIALGVVSTPDRSIVLTNCSELWACAFKNWGGMHGSKKLIAHQGDSAWNCYDVASDPEENKPLDVAQCGDLLPMTERVMGGRPF